MTTLGPSTPGTVANALGTHVSWANTGNIAASDNASMTASLDGSDVLLARTKIVRATTFSPSLAIPAGAIVDGIEVEIERKASNLSEVKDNVVQLVRGGNLIGNNLADTGSTWPTSDTVKTYGSSSNLWGVVFSDGTINSTFGVAISVLTVGAGAVTASIDRVRMTVTYHEPAPEVPPAGAGETRYTMSDAPTAVYTLTDAPVAVYTIADQRGGA